MGTKNNPAPNDCYANALPDEPMFTLLARDTDAPALVMRWAIQREEMIFQGKKPCSDMAMVDEAFAVAREMRKWREEHNGEWRAPVPLLEALDEKP